MKFLTTLTLPIFICLSIAHAAQLTLPPNIESTSVGSTLYGVEFSADEVNTLMMTSGLLAVTNTGNGNAAAIYCSSGATAPDIHISGGAINVREENSGTGTWIDSRAPHAEISISGGAFTLSETGHNAAQGFVLTGADASLDITGGSFAMAHWYSSPDGHFVSAASSASVRIAGGKFDLDEACPFPYDLVLADTSTLVLDCLHYDARGLSINSDGTLNDSTGTVSGTLLDGNSFSFTFSREDDATLQLSGGTELHIPPNIDVSTDGSAATAVSFTSAATNALIMTGGTLRVANTNNGAACLIHASSQGPSAYVNISGGELVVEERNVGTATVLWLDQAGSAASISGGTITVSENGHNAVETFKLTAANTSLDVSGGTFSIENWYPTPDGYLFSLSGEGASLKLSGGEFQLDEIYPFPYDLVQTGDNTIWLDCDYLIPGDWSLDENNEIVQTNGTISGALLDGSEFSFRFSKDTESTLRVTGEIAISDDFYVSAHTGDDELNDGSFALPFKTISRAADEMGLFDTCVIREGIYRETVTPRLDHLTFTAYSNENVVVSGCDLLEPNWAPYNGGIYQTSVDSQVKQLFLNGARQNLARHPNFADNQDMFSTEELKWTKTIPVYVDSSKNSTGTVEMASTEIYDDDHWVGGFYTGMNGNNPFSSAIGNIVDSTSKYLTIVNLAYFGHHNADNNASWGAGSGYIINHINALDSAGEWYWNDETLYYYPSDADALDEAVFEARTRQWGIDLTGRSDIVIDGIQLHAAGFLIADATNNLIQNCSSRFPAAWSQYYYAHDYGGVEDGSVGNYLSGADNVISNTTIAHSWGSGIRIEGERNTLIDSTVEDADWCGQRMSPVQLYGVSNLVTRCTIRDGGRDCIEAGQRGLSFGKMSSHATITHNLIERAGHLCGDNGLIYLNAQGSTLLADIEIAYNHCYTNLATHYSCGIYLDNRTSSAKVHHNVVDTGDTAYRGIVANGPDDGDHHDIWIVNNTIVGDITYSIDINTQNGGIPTNIWVYNNIHQDSLHWPAEEVQMGLQDKVSDFTEFIDADASDYRLTSTSSYIDPATLTGQIDDNGTPAWFINDSSSSDNPLYQYPLPDSTLTNMYENGWEFEFTCRAVQDAGGGAGFCGWGVKSANDPGWGLSANERVGFSIQLDTDINAFRIAPAHNGPTLTLETDSANDYHTIRCVGAAHSSEYEFFVDGVSQGTYDISEGNTSSTYNNAITFGSGNSSGIGRETRWTHIDLKQGGTSVGSYDVSTQTPETGLLVSHPGGQGWISAKFPENLVFVGINDDYAGTAPDLGALEYGQDDWTVGSATVAGPDYTAVDTDGDGLTDLVELALGLDPTSTDSNGNGIPDGSEIDYINDDLFIVDQTARALHLQFTPTTNWLHTLVSCDNLTSNNWEPFIIDIPGTQSNFTVAVQTAAIKQFYQIESSIESQGLPVAYEQNFDDDACTNSVTFNGNARRFHTDDTGVAPESGTHYIQFLGSNGGGKLSFDLPTETHLTYAVNLALSVASSNDQVPQLDIVATGAATESIPAILGASIWQPAAYLFKATTTNTTVTISEPNVETSAQAPRLDSVIIYQLPSDLNASAIPDS